MYADLVGLLPADWILVGLLGGTARLPASLLTCLSLLRLLQLVRPPTLLLLLLLLFAAVAAVLAAAVLAAVALLLLLPVALLLSCCCCCYRAFC